MDLEETGTGPSDLLARVEDVRDRDRPFRRSELQESGDAALRITRPHARQRVPVSTDLTHVARHRVEVGDQEHHRVPDVRVSNHVVPDARDREVAERRQLVGHRVGDRAFGLRDRRNPHEALHEVQSAHVATPWSRRMAFRATLSWDSPSSRRRTTRTQGRKNSPPGNSRRRCAETATQ